MKSMIFATHTKLRNILLFLIVILVTFYIFLRGGISAEHLKLASYNLSGLYLKLDKKLILKIESIDIPQEHKKSQITDFEQTLDSVKTLLHFFEYIKIDSIHFKNEEYSFLFSDQIFYLTSDEYELAAHGLSRQGQHIRAMIDLLYLKKYDLRLDAIFVYNYKKDKAIIKGNIIHQDIQAKFLLNKEKNKLYYALKTNRFNNLKSLIDKFHIPIETSSWITDKVQASSYVIHYFKGVAKLNKKGFDLQPHTMRAQGVLSDAKIYFQPILSPVENTKIVINFSDETLDFELVNPHYMEKNLTGSSVQIRNFFHDHPVAINVHLKFKTQLDDTINTILQSYDIGIPVRQKGEPIDSIVDLNITPSTNHVDYSGDFELNKSTLFIHKFELPLMGGGVKLRKNHLDFSNILLDAPQYKATVDGKLTLNKSKIALNANIDRLELTQSNNDAIVLKPNKYPLNISYGENPLKITLPTLDASIQIDSDKNKSLMDFNDLTKIKEALSPLPIAINGGSLQMKTHDFKEFFIEGKIKRDECFFYTDEEECYTYIPFDILFNTKNLQFNAFDKRLIYNSKDSQITIDGINLDLFKFFENSKNSTQEKPLAKRVKINGRKSVLRYKKYKLITDSYTLGVLENRDFHFRGQMDGDEVTATKTGQELEVSATRIKDKMLHPLINFKGLQQGRYSLNLKGIPGTNIKGVIRLDGGVIRDFKVYNNLLALINTLPALATLHAPGYSSEGFKINKGVIKFTILEGEKIVFDSIVVEGKSATISGNGVVDLEKETIDMDLAIQTAKPMGKIISELPLLGYILLGDDESLITVGVHIGGTLAEPKANTTTIKDVLLLPFKMIQRTLTGKK